MKIFRQLPFAIWPLALFIIFSISSQAQNASWLWAKVPGTADNNRSKAIAADGSGNVYITGYFAGSITFGSTTLNSNGFTDIFIAKYSPAGTVVWARSAGGSSGDNSGEGIATDASGNVYVTGYFNTSATFGSTTLSNGGNEDMFLVKYDPNGTPLWAAQTTGNLDEHGLAVATDPSGDVVVTGYFESGGVGFGVGGPILTNDAMLDVFVVKYTSSGSVVWAKSAAGTKDETGNGIATDGSGNIYVTGTFGSSGLSLGSATLVNSGTNDDMFLAKYSGSGALVWARSGNATGSVRGFGVDVESNGNAYVAGYFGGTSLTFGDSTVTGTLGSDDMYVVKFDDAGKVLWGKAIGGYGYEIARGIAVDGNGNAYVSGTFATNNLAFGSSTLTVTGASSSNVFVARFSTYGDVVWAISSDGDGFDIGNGVSLDGTGNVYITGFLGSVNVDFGSTALNPGGGYDQVFVAKLSGGTAGIERRQAETVLQLFPNPATDFINLRITENSANNQASYNITDITGREVGAGFLNGTINRLDISMLSPGFYFISVPENSSSFKIVKQ